MKKSKIFIGWNLSGILLLDAIVLNIFNDYGDIKWLTWLFYAALVLFVVVSVLLPKYFCCPHCGKPIHPRNAGSEFCPNCGKKIN